MIKINLIADAQAAAAKKPTGRKAEVSLGARQGEVILGITIVLFIAIAGLVYFKVTSETKRLQADKRKKTKLKAELQQFIDRAEELERHRDRLSRKVDVINQLKQNQMGPVRIMDEASRALPELVWLERLNLSGNTLTLDGMAMDENAIANYYSNLEASPFFKEPDLTNMVKSTGAFKFSLSVVFTQVPEAIEGSAQEEMGG